MKSAAKRLGAVVSRVVNKVIGAESAKRRATMRRGNPSQRGITQGHTESIRSTIGGTNIGGLG